MKREPRFVIDELTKFVAGLPTSVSEVPLSWNVSGVRLKSPSYAKTAMRVLTAPAGGVAKPVTGMSRIGVPPFTRLKPSKIVRLRGSAVASE